MSFPRKEWVTADPEFWGPKPVKTTKTPQRAPGKAGEKTTAAK